MTAKKRGFWQEVKHKLNVLHIYARLCELTTNNRKALKICRLIEKNIFYKLLYIGKQKDEE